MVKLPGAPSASSDATQNASAKQDTKVWISGKQVEEFDYQQINKRHSDLQNLRIVVLDRMLLRQATSAAPHPDLKETCANIAELDLSRNLFESLDEVAHICVQLKGLRTLTLEYSLAT